VVKIFGTHEIGGIAIPVAGSPVVFPPIRCEVIQQVPAHLSMPAFGGFAAFEDQDSRSPKKNALLLATIICLEDHGECHLLATLA
jgi:hypothetical protein